MKEQWITFQAEGTAICKSSNSRTSFACFRNRQAIVAGVSLVRGREPADEIGEVGWCHRNMNFTSSTLGN